MALCARVIEWSGAIVTCSSQKPLVAVCVCPQVGSLAGSRILLGDLKMVQLVWDAKQATCRHSQGLLSLTGEERGEVGSCVRRVLCGDNACRSSTEADTNKSGKES